MKKSILLISLIMSVITAQPGGFVPNAISFQGMLTNVDGSVYQDGDYELTFRLIRIIQGGTEQVMWEETHTAAVSNGVFSVILGSNTPLPQNVPGNAMLETQVGEEILAPRQPLTSVPFALRSNSAQFSNQALVSDSSGFAQMSYHSVIADTANYVMNAPTVDTVLYAHEANHAEEATYADEATNSEALEGYNADDFILNSDYIEPISINLPTTTFNMETGGSWYIIRTLTVTVTNDMDLRCFGFFNYTFDGPCGTQIALYDNNGQMIDDGVHSFRNPSSLNSFVSTEITFSVSPGTYTVGMHGTTQNAGVVENVYLSLLGVPTTSDRNYSLISPPNIQNARPYMNRPITIK